MSDPEPKKTKDPDHIGDLTPDPVNRRRHTQRNLGMIVDSLHSVGAGRSIVIDEDNVVLAGNGLIEAAGEAGITKVMTVDAPGDTIVAVRRTGLTPEQKRKLALYDNRTAELARWDTDQLSADVEAGLSLDAFFFEDELAALIPEEEPPPESGFEPNTRPESSTDPVKPADVTRAAGELDERFKKDVQHMPILCPDCGHEFFLDKTKLPKGD